MQHKETTMKLVVMIALLGMTFAQDEKDHVDPDLDASVSATLEWPENDDANAGAIVKMAYSKIGEGSCIVNLPEMVRLFHVMNAHVVPGDQTSPVEGNYKIAAPADWEAVNGTINALIIFDRGNIFNISEIEFRCDSGDKEDLSVYSFPQNTLLKEASSNVHYRPGFHVGDVLTITLPAPVAQFNITGADSELEIINEGNTWTVSGFKSVEGIDDHKEVHFTLNYENVDGTGSDWFSAGDITVAVSREEPPGEEYE